MSFELWAVAAVVTVGLLSALGLLPEPRLSWPELAALSGGWAWLVTILERNLEAAKRAERELDYLRQRLESVEAHVKQFRPPSYDDDDDEDAHP